MWSKLKNCISVNAPFARKICRCVSGGQMNTPHKSVFPSRCIVWGDVFGRYFCWGIWQIRWRKRQWWTSGHLSFLWRYITKIKKKTCFVDPLIRIILAVIVFSNRTYSSKTSLWAKEALINTETYIIKTKWSEEFWSIQSIKSNQTTILINAV